jgi:ATP-dependent RNA helicase DDX54/DBP10
MPGHKRKRLQSPQEGGDLDFIASGTEVDISSVLVGKRPRRDLGEDNDDDLQDMIHFISKRDIKIGTEFLKKTKGKLTKGEVGGGSFQSMGKTFKVIPSNI